MIHEITKTMYQEYHKMGYLTELAVVAGDKDNPANEGNYIATIVCNLFKRENREPVMGMILHVGDTSKDEKEMKEAKQAVANLGVKSEFLTFNPFDLEAVRNNRRERCYFCKKAIFEKFVVYAKAQGLKYVLDGTNADDLKVYRPGRKALQELGIISPLAEVGLTKADIRKLSAELGLTTASKPAVPCLATRFPYDTYLDDAALARVAKGETELKKMLPEVVDLRLRVHGNLARLEVAKENLSDVFVQYQEYFILD